MGYDDSHTDDDCDKCLRRIGRENLKALTWLYLSRSDDKHPDMSHLVGKPPVGYRQYWCCKDCYDKA